MKGITLSTTSSASTPPWRPAPETAWSEVIITVRTPKASWSGFSETASPVVVQLGMGAMKPRQPRVRRWSWMASACASLIPGIRMGTSGSYRNADAVLMTGTRSAKRGSQTSATSFDTALKTRSRGCARSCSSLRHGSESTEGSARPSANQRLAPLGSRRASPKDFPAELSEAPTAATVNQGCRSSAASTCWPARPVAPSTPTRIRPHPDPPPHAGEGNSGCSCEHGGRFLRFGEHLLEFRGARLRQVQAVSITHLEELGRLEAAAGDADHDRFLAPNAPSCDQFLETNHDDAAGRLTQDPLRLGQQRHAFLHRVLAAGGTPPARGAYRPCGVAAVGGVADRKRLRDTVRPHRRHLVPALLDRGADRRAAFRLRGVDAGRGPLEEADADQFLEGLGRLGQERPSSDGHDQVVGCAPTELLHDLERQCLAAFRIEGAEVDVDDRPAVQISELNAQPVDVVVGAIDLDDGGAVRAGGSNFPRLEVGGDENQGMHSGARGVGGHRAGAVSGGRGGE